MSAAARTQDGAVIINGTTVRQGDRILLLPRMGEDCRRVRVERPVLAEARICDCGAIGHLNKLTARGPQLTAFANKAQPGDFIQLRGEERRLYGRGQAIIAVRGPFPIVRESKQAEHMECAKCVGAQSQWSANVPGGPPSESRKAEMVRAGMLDDRGELTDFGDSVLECLS